ncbi:MAG: ATP-binding protein [Terriglobales bacterium]
MVQRRYWLNLLEEALRSRPVVWLAGVRRVGKTCLCQGLSGIEYFDCELPRVRRMLRDPEEFLDGVSGQRIVLDEIHRLPNPSELLKIAADHYPRTRIVATGSSTLGASRKFKDTLAGRKRDVWLTPMCLPDLEDARQPSLKRRFLRGGLPPFLLPEKLEERDFQEWMDAYWAKDIQELFRLEKRDSFQKFTELVMAHSSGIFEATRFAAPCEVSRTTIGNYLRALEATFVAHVLRPFNRRRPTEIIAAPKVYGFDTGFVCYYRGWQDLRADDLGPLWEHFVLNEMMARLQSRRISYWRDKRGHEIDFVIAALRQKPMAIESKWSAESFDPVNLRAFRSLHPHGENIVVAQDLERPYSRSYGELRVRFESLTALIDRLSANAKASLSAEE